MFAGQIAWLMASTMSEKWLRDNDPTFEPPGFFGKFFLGRLITPSDP